MTEIGMKRNGEEKERKERLERRDRSESSRGRENVEEKRHRY